MRKDIAGQITVQFVSLFKGSFFTISVFFSSSQATEMEGWGGQRAASHKEEIRWASSTKSSSFRKKVLGKFVLHQVIG